MKNIIKKIFKILLKIIIAPIIFVFFILFPDCFAYESFSEFQIYTNAATDGPYTSNCVPNSTYTSIDNSESYNLVVGGGGCFRFETSFLYGSGSYSSLNFEILNIPSGFHNNATSTGGTIFLSFNGGDTKTTFPFTGSYLVDFTDYYGYTFNSMFGISARRIQFNVDNNISCGIYEIPMKFTAVRLTTGDYQTFYNRIKINVNSNCVDNTSQTSSGTTSNYTPFFNFSDNSIDLQLAFSILGFGFFTFIVFIIYLLTYNFYDRSTDFDIYQ